MNDGFDEVNSYALMSGGGRGTIDDKEDDFGWVSVRGGNGGKFVDEELKLLLSSSFLDKDKDGRDVREDTKGALDFKLADWVVGNILYKSSITEELLEGVEEEQEEGSVDVMEDDENDEQHLLK